jgi:hypothetical protein
LWFAAIIKRKQDLADLAPKGCFISAEAVERVVGQVGETQKATRELSGGIGGKFDRFRRGASEKDSIPFVMLAGAASRSKLADSARPNSA